MRHGPLITTILLALAGVCGGEASGGLELGPLPGEDPAILAQESRREGDPARGALVFARPELNCRGCHLPGEDSGLGPDLSRLGDEVEPARLIESILRPSAIIREGFETIQVATADGRVVTGLLVEEGPDRVVLRDAMGDRIAIATAEIEERGRGTSSLMPDGLVSSLASRQEFLDLARYVIEVAEGGPDRARELEPDPALVAAMRAQPEYESRLDHAALISGWDRESLGRGRAIYERVCANCHGTLDRPGSLPTSPRFASAEFKNGADPISMYRTLTRGFGRMMPQTWMVPRQKYDVIHYIREAYLREHNPSRYVDIDGLYLARLPEGDTLGPEPTAIEPWVAMDYGPVMLNTFEVGRDGTNFATKGVAVRLDPGPGGISRGRHWMVYDHDTLRMAGAWSGEGFIDWNGIQFNGRHGVHPRVVGRVGAANPTGPGWAGPGGSGFADPRPLARDDRPYGPLPRPWARYRGLALHGHRAILSYTVGEVPVLETPGLVETPSGPVFTRTFVIGPRPAGLTLQVAHLPDEAAEPRPIDGHPTAVDFRSGGDVPPSEDGPAGMLPFDGATCVEVGEAADIDFGRRDLTISARIRTTEGGTIFAQVPAEGDWEPDAKALFVRGGRLVFDVGWVGAVESRRRVDDGGWHDVAMSFEHETGLVRLYIDGRPDAEGRLKPRGGGTGHVVRLGFAAPDFPRPTSYFRGRIDFVRIEDRALQKDDVARPGAGPPLADWEMDSVGGGPVTDRSGKGLDGLVRRGPEAGDRADRIVAGIDHAPAGLTWDHSGSGDLRLRIPAGPDLLRFVLWFSGPAPGVDPRSLASSVRVAPPDDLQALMRGGPPRWPEEIPTRVVTGPEDGPFAVDVLSHPGANPWNSLVRFSGLEFLPGGDSAVLCCWDGDVWRVDGLSRADGELTWRRIASGLFQPLGIRLIGGDLYVSCRDQIAILRDRDGDGEVDYYENFNNDHQVTEHFHEFATGLATDADGNLYYAKAGRHGEEALVPHHGTLLRVNPDGRRTEVVATGFRAPNGVLVNPDGTFFVTDQEGHWTPKNRINWVREGRFYGYMWGYHDVDDPSDSAMEPPVCWITNAMDRSPGEPIRVESEAWGPLDGALLELSYGTGRILVVPLERAGDRMQGGVSPLPIPPLPTGVMRGRFHPDDGQLYACGMFAWAGDRQEPGGFYRIRATGRPSYAPIGLHSCRDGLELTFSDPLEPESVADPGNFAVTAWSLRRTAGYGSEHHDERGLRVASARLADDGRTVHLTIPEISPTPGMEVRYSLRGADDSPIRGSVHLTIHQLGPPVSP